jgi:ribosomal protein L12E/L44/L45/RPP1/RPP2
MLKTNKEFTYIDYLTFIKAVVDKTIEEGIEQKNFYIALFGANIFYGYEPPEDEFGNSDKSVIWNELRNFDIKDDKDKIAFKGTDLYKILNDTYDNMLPEILPISKYIYEEMLETINDKIYDYQNRDVTKEAIANLLNKIGDFVDTLEEKYKDVDIQEVSEKFQSYADAIKQSDFKETAKQLAHVIHDEKKREEKEKKKKE